MKQQHSTKYGLKAVKCVVFLHSKQNQLGTSDANTLANITRNPYCVNMKLKESNYVNYSIYKAFTTGYMRMDWSFGSSALKLGLDSVAFSVMRTLAQLLSICYRTCPRFAAAFFNPHPNTVLESLPAPSLLSYLQPGDPNSPITNREPCKQLKRPYWH